MAHVVYAWPLIIFFSPRSSGDSALTSESCSQFLVRREGGVGGGWKKRGKYKKWGHWVALKIEQDNVQSALYIGSDWFVHTWIVTRFFNRLCNLAVAIWVFLNSPMEAHCTEKSSQNFLDWKSYKYNKISLVSNVWIYRRGKKLYTPY